MQSLLPIKWTRKLPSTTPTTNLMNALKNPTNNFLIEKMTSLLKKQFHQILICLQKTHQKKRDEYTNNYIKKLANNAKGKQKK